MKSTYLLPFSTLFLFSSSAYAMPITATVRVALGNSFTGAWANTEVPLDNITYQVYDLWRNSAVQQGEAIIASTADMTTLPDNSTCVFHNEDGQAIGELYTGAPGAQTHLEFTSLNTTGTADLTNATVICMPYFKEEIFLSP